MRDVECPICGKRLKAPDEAVGRKVRCSCGHGFILERESAAEPFAEPDDDPPSFLNVTRAEAGAESRYPVLAFYLKILRIGATVVAVGGAIIAILLICFGFLMLFTAETRPAGFASIGPGLAIGIAALVEYVATIAAVQFVYVILDIESHLRAIAGRT